MQKNRERGRERGSEGERERGREGGREREREGGREGGRERERNAVTACGSSVWPRVALVGRRR